MVLAHETRSTTLKIKSLKLWRKHFLNDLKQTIEEDIFSGWSGALIAFTLVAPILPKKIMAAQQKAIKEWLDVEIPKRGFYTQMPGLAHGLSGLALALRLFSNIDHWQRGLRVAKLIEKYIDSQYQRKLGGWKSSELTMLPLESWCNGSSGIVLARRLSGARFSSTVNQSAIANRLKKRIRKIKSSDFALCHGQYGFAAAYRALTGEKIHLSVPTKSEFHSGLLNGNEGVAYSILSLSYPCPSILAGIKRK